MSRFLKLMRWLTAVALMLIFMQLAWQCIDIYLDGNSLQNLDKNGVHISSVFSMEDVSLRLRQMTVPLWAAFILVCVTAVLQTSCKENTNKSLISPENRLRLIKARVTELPERSRIESNTRVVIRSCAAIIVLVEAGLCFAYLFNQENFISWDLEAVMGNMMLAVCPHVILSFLALMAATHAVNLSYLRELDSLKSASKTAIPSVIRKKTVPVLPIRILLYAIAVLFILLGVMNGGLRDVLVKAINICTECIGLG